MSTTVLLKNRKKIPTKYEGLENDISALKASIIAAQNFAMVKVMGKSTL